jgi:hypothetical protein
MLTFTPPVVKPYAPAIQPIASARVTAGLLDTVNNIANIQIRLIDANGKGIATAPGAIPRMTSAQATAFLATPAVAGELVGAFIERAIKPYLLAAYGLTPS